MSKVRVICPNHGVIKEIEMACMWLGNPPMPEVQYAYCSKCGSKTIIEYDEEPHAKSWSYKDQNDFIKQYKKREVEFYRNKYKHKYPNLFKE